MDGFPLYRPHPPLVKRLFRSMHLTWARFICRRFCKKLIQIGWGSTVQNPPFIRRYPTIPSSSSFLPPARDPSIGPIPIRCIRLLTPAQTAHASASASASAQWVGHTYVCLFSACVSTFSSTTQLRATPTCYIILIWNWYLRGRVWRICTPLGR